MKRLGVIVLCGMLTGCGGLLLDDFRSTNRENLSRITIGMTRAQASQVMGSRSVSIVENQFSIFNQTSTTVNNPYRTAAFTANNKQYDIMYYYTDLKRADGVITDDELTPIVFEGGKVIGWGQEMLSGTLNKYEIRLR
jgi:hypothetical protein